MQVDIVGWMKIPRIVKCPECGKLFNKGASDGRFRYKCPFCRSYIAVWDFREFFNSNKTCYGYGKLEKVDYEEVKPLLDIIRDKKLGFDEMECEP